MAERQEIAKRETTVLVAVDFPPCSRAGLRKAKSILRQEPDRIVVLHVIDKDFVDMEKIFFGSTTERVLRFIKRPVLCIPENEDYKLAETSTGKKDHEDG